MSDEPLMFRTKSGRLFAIVGEPVQSYGNYLPRDGEDYPWMIEIQLIEELRDTKRENQPT